MIDSRFRRILNLLGLALALSLASGNRSSAGAGAAGGFNALKDSPTGDGQTASGCIECHNSNQHMPGLYQQYRQSRHAQMGVECQDCHSAAEEDRDGFLHHDSWISVVVTPKDCAKCHLQIVFEFEASGHAEAYRLVDPSDPVHGLGGVLLDLFSGSTSHSPGERKHERTVLGARGCFDCHGGKILINDDGHPTAETWPNAGIGRINPDGSRGNCAACHERHTFSAAQARKPAACAVCHNAGGGVPDMEAFESSRHGTTLAAFSAFMNYEHKSWVVGVDYFAAPSCATCHMARTPDLEEEPGLSATHNVNERVGWNKRLAILSPAAVSERCHLKGQLHPLPELPHARQNRTRMKKVCAACHSAEFVRAGLEQFTALATQTGINYLEHGGSVYDKGMELINTAARLVPKHPDHDGYRPFTHPIDSAWLDLCNSNSNRLFSGAAHFSSGLVELGITGMFGSWHAFLDASTRLADTYAEEYKDQQAVVDKVEELRALIGEYGG